MKTRRLIHTTEYDVQSKPHGKKNKEEIFNSFIK